MSRPWYSVLPILALAIVSGCKHYRVDQEIADLPIPIVISTGDSDQLMGILAKVEAEARCYAVDNEPYRQVLLIQMKFYLDLSLAIDSQNGAEIERLWQLDRAKRLSLLRMLLRNESGDAKDLWGNALASAPINAWIDAFEDFYVALFDSAVWLNHRHSGKPIVLVPPADGADPHKRPWSDPSSLNIFRSNIESKIEELWIATHQVPSLDASLPRAITGLEAMVGEVFQGISNGGGEDPQSTSMNGWVTVDSGGRSFREGPTFDAYQKISDDSLDLVRGRRRSNSTPAGNSPDASQSDASEENPSPTSTESGSQAARQPSASQTPESGPSAGSVSSQTAESGPSANSVLTQTVEPGKSADFASPKAAESGEPNKFPSQDPVLAQVFADSISRRERDTRLATLIKSRIKFLAEDGELKGKTVADLQRQKLRTTVTNAVIDHVNPNAKWAVFILPKRLAERKASHDLDGQSLASSSVMRKLAELALSYHVKIVFTSDPASLTSAIGQFKPREIEGISFNSHGNLSGTGIFDDKTVKLDSEKVSQLLTPVKDRFTEEGVACFDTCWGAGESLNGNSPARAFSATIPGFRTFGKAGVLHERAATVQTGPDGKAMAFERDAIIMPYFLNNELRFRPNPKVIPRVRLLLNAVDQAEIGTGGFQKTAAKLLEISKKEKGGLSSMARVLRSYAPVLASSDADSWLKTEAKSTDQVDSLTQDRIKRLIVLANAIQSIAPKFSAAYDQAKLTMDEIPWAIVNEFQPSQEFREKITRLWNLLDSEFDFTKRNTIIEYSLNQFLKVKVDKFGLLGFTDALTIKSEGFRQLLEKTIIIENLKVSHLRDVLAHKLEMKYPHPQSFEKAWNLIYDALPPPNPGIESNQKLAKNSLAEVAQDPGWNVLQDFRRSANIPGLLIESANPPYGRLLAVQDSYRGLIFYDASYLTDTYLKDLRSKLPVDVSSLPQNYLGRDVAEIIKTGDGARLYAISFLVQRSKLSRLATTMFPGISGAFGVKLKDMLSNPDELLDSSALKLFFMEFFKSNLSNFGRWYTISDGLDIPEIFEALESVWKDFDSRGAAIMDPNSLLIRLLVSEAISFEPTFIANNRSMTYASEESLKYILFYWSRGKFTKKNWDADEGQGSRIYEASSSAKKILPRVRDGSNIAGLLEVMISTGQDWSNGLEISEAQVNAALPIVANRMKGEGSNPAKLSRLFFMSNQAQDKAKRFVETLQVYGTGIADILKELIDWSESTEFLRIMYPVSRNWLEPFLGLVKESEMIEVKNLLEIKSDDSTDVQETKAFALSYLNHKP